MSVALKSGSSANLAFVDTANQLAVAPSNTPANTGTIRNASEVDNGSILGSVLLRSPEADSDYRLRVAADLILDDETFNYTAQNTGKFNTAVTTMAFAYATGGWQTNSGSITTTTTGVTKSSYAMFPFFSSGEQLYTQFEMALSAQPVANSIIDVGLFLKNAANPYAPTDGVYFRHTSAGLQGVINHNGTETATSVFNFTYANNTVYKFTIVAANGFTEFWINDVLYGRIATPIAQAQPFMSTALPFSIRHVITGGAAGGVLQATLRGYGVSVGGTAISKSLGEIGNGVFGSYQGLSGGTMGSLANYANNTNPTPAVMTNTTAALGTGLGGQFWETATIALNTDGIVCSYQVPAGTVSVPGKRLAIYGVTFDGYIQTALTGGGFNEQFALAFGHTAVSLATAEAVAAKAPRRVALGSRTVAAAAAALTQLATISRTFSKPIYVNPGEFVALVSKKVGTVATAGVIAHNVTFDAAWE